MTEQRNETTDPRAELLDGEFIRNVADKMLPDLHYENTEEKLFGLLVCVARVMVDEYKSSMDLSEESAIDLTLRGLKENLES